MKSILCILFVVFQVFCPTGFVAADTSTVAVKNAADIGLTAVKNTAAEGIVTESRPLISALNPSSTSSAKTGGTDAFVAKHLFLPEAFSAGGKDGLNGDKPLLRIFKIAERQLVFSGVIASDRGRKALILNKRAKDPAKRSHSTMLGKGDTIMDLSIEDVGPNFVVLATQGQTMRLNLYQGKKNRPKPIPQPKPVTQQSKTARVKTGNKQHKAASIAKNTKTTAGKLTNKANRQRAIARAKAAEKASAKLGKGSTSQTNVFTKANNPFANTIKKGNSQNTTTKGTNPFLDAIRKAMEKKK